MSAARSPKALLALALLGTVIGAVYALERAQAGQIANGISVAGVDVGGLSQAEAREILRRELGRPLASPLRVRAGDRVFALRARRLRARIDLAATIDAAMEASEEGGTLDRLSHILSEDDVDREIAPRLRYSRRALGDFVSNVAARVNRPARDARVEPSAGGIAVVPDREGRSLEERRLIAAISAELRTPLEAGSVEAEVVRTQPAVTRRELPERYPYFLTVERPAFKLRLYRNLKLVKTYTIGVGRVGFETPAGLYHIQNRAVNPSWHVPDRAWAGELAGKVIPPGPDNPIKARWMGIYDGAGIHGTDDVASLGTAASHGCIRMAIPEVIELYDQIPVQTPIYIG